MPETLSAVLSPPFYYYLLLMSIVIPLLHIYLILYPHHLITTGSVAKEQAPRVAATTTPTPLKLSGPATKEQLIEIATRLNAIELKLRDFQDRLKARDQAVAKATKKTYDMSLEIEELQGAVGMHEWRLDKRMFGVLDAEALAKNAETATEQQQQQQQQQAPSTSKPPAPQRQQLNRGRAYSAPGLQRVPFELDLAAVNRRLEREGDGDAAVDRRLERGGDGDAAEDEAAASPTEESAGGVLLGKEGGSGE
ncbi:hypothetical protein LTR50_001671 [Elasticomyces elasticus]|nr:hypothetical protein LTR50_001671 [Elasticomyces elasticus]